MNNALLMIVKIALTVLLLPVLWACGIVLHGHIMSFPSSYGEFFMWGIFGFLILFLFFYQFWGVYEFGQKVMTGIFKFLNPSGSLKNAPNAGSRGKICIKGKNYTLAKIAWLYMTGVYPSSQVKHIDDSKPDYKFNNLMLADMTVNKNHVDIGVNVNDNSYAAHLIINGKTVDLGIYDSSEAVLQIIKTAICSK